MEPEGADEDSTLVSSDTGSFLENFADDSNLPQPVLTSLGPAEMTSFEKDSVSAVLQEYELGDPNLPDPLFSSLMEDDSRVHEINDITHQPSTGEDEVGQVDLAFLPASLEAVADEPPLSSSTDPVVVANPPELPTESRDEVQEPALESGDAMTLNVIRVTDADTAMADESAGPVVSERFLANEDGAERDHSPPKVNSSEVTELNTEEVRSAANSSSPSEDGPSVVQERASPLGDNQLSAPTSASSPPSGPRTNSVQDGVMETCPGSPISTEPTVNKTEERESDGARASLGATESPSNGEEPGAVLDVGDANGEEPGIVLDVGDANGAESQSTLVAQGEVVQEDDVAEHELQPAKRAKTSRTAYTGADAVSVMLGQTAEMILVLAGMSQMRAGRASTEYEKELASTAYRNLGILVSRVAPSNLVAEDSLEHMVQDLNAKIVAQKRNEEQAWIDAVTEAEALANARALAIAKAEAEAAAAAAAAAAAVAAKAKAEAEELERRRQVALPAAAVGTNGHSSNSGLSSAGGPPFSSGNSVYMQPPPSTPVAGQDPVLPNQMNSSQQQVSVSNAGEVPRLATPVKVTSMNGQSPTPPPSKGHPGRPPKVRNRARKEHAAAALSAPDYLSQMQSQATDSQKVQMTHKQLCLGVQQYIREHVPPVSQTQQALQPTYISTAFPCQVCKTVTEDTNGVLVCDSCDQVTHVKCLQPPPPKSAAKNDWNCRACLTASRGSKFPAMYGLLRRGSPNSVQLWPPHDTPNSNSKASAALANGSFGALLSTASERKATNSGSQSGQKKSSLEIDTRAQESGHEGTGGNLGHSPHLVVHLVNEPSPKPNALSKSSHTLRGHGKRSSHSAPGSKSSSGLSTEDRRQAPGGSLTETTTLRDMLSESQTHHEASTEVEDNETLSTSWIAKEGREQDQSGNVPAQTDKSGKGEQSIESNERNNRSAPTTAGKQGDIPLPIVMEWVGGSCRRADGKVYYRACRVGGVTFSVSDCALFRPETADVPPYIARLQVLWEDVETSHKWVRVSWCYYPSDIPLLMGRPGPTVPDEVYESNHCDNNLLGSIQGPCYVLPPTKFREEKERRNALKQGGKLDDLPPVFLSRYMYDAPKGIFRPLQE